MNTYFPEPPSVLASMFFNFEADNDFCNSSKKKRRNIWTYVLYLVIFIYYSICCFYNWSIALLNHNILKIIIFWIRYLFRLTREQIENESTKYSYQIYAKDIVKQSDFKYYTRKAIRNNALPSLFKVLFSQ
jgi:hypothetical protein